MAAGVTLKYTQVRHAVAVGRLVGIPISATTLKMDVDSFLIHTRIADDMDFADYLNGGIGVGPDLGTHTSARSRFTVGAAVQNATNTFA